VTVRYSDYQELLESEARALGAHKDGPSRPVCGQRQTVPKRWRSGRNVSKLRLKCPRREKRDSEDGRS
jgi:hypothetical protein